MGSRLVAGFGVAASAALLVGIGLAMTGGDGLMAALADMLGAPWGRVTLLDLAVGLIAVGIWIRIREGSRRRAAPWWLALALTGNLATAVYIVYAARRSATVEELLLGRRRPVPAS